MLRQKTEMIKLRMGADLISATFLITFFMDFGCLKAKIEDGCKNVNP